MKKDREITINVIESNKVNIRKLADFFAQKYSEKSRKETQR